MSATSTRKVRRTALLGSAATVSQKGLGRTGSMGVIGLGADFTLGCAPHPLSDPMDLPQALEFSRFAARLRATQPDLVAHLLATVDAGVAWQPCAAEIAAEGDAEVLARMLRQLRARVVVHTLL